MTNIVPNRVAEDVIQRRFRGSVQTGAADDDDELALVVEAWVLLGGEGDGDGGKWCGGEGCGGFVEENGVFGGREIGLEWWG